MMFSCPVADYKLVWLIERTPASIQIWMMWKAGWGLHLSKRNHREGNCGRLAVEESMQAEQQGITLSALMIFEDREMANHCKNTQNLHILLIMRGNLLKQRKENLLQVQKFIVATVVTGAATLAVHLLINILLLYFV